MKIYELQEPLNINPEFWLKIIDDTAGYLKDGIISEATYQSQLSINYSLMRKPEECKKHAALVPDWASTQDKNTALVAVAHILVYENKIEEALPYYHQAHVLDPEYEDIIEEIGWCYIELEQWAQAQDWFTKGTLLNAGFEDFWEGLAHSLVNQQKYDEALPAYKNALELCNKEIHGFYYDHLIGECYADLNDFYRALGHYTKCLDANPTYPHALNDIAALYFNEEGDMSAAIGYLKKAEVAAEEDDDDTVLRLVYRNLAKIYKKTKEFELQAHYQEKLLGTYGFGGSFDVGDEDE